MVSGTMPSFCSETAMVASLPSATSPNSTAAGERVSSPPTCRTAEPWPQPTTPPSTATAAADKIRRMSHPRPAGAFTRSVPRYGQAGKR